MLLVLLGANAHDQGDAVRLAQILDPMRLSIVEQPDLAGPGLKCLGGTVVLAAEPRARLALEAQVELVEVVDMPSAIDVATDALSGRNTSDQHTAEHFALAGINPVTSAEMAGVGLTVTRGLSGLDELTFYAVGQGSSGLALAGLGDLDAAGHIYSTPVPLGQYELDGLDTAPAFEAVRLGAARAAVARHALSGAPLRRANTGRRPPAFAALYLRVG